MSSISISNLKLESKIIVFLVMLLTAFSAVLGWNTYQELNLRESSDLSLSAKINHSGEITPINIECGAFYGDYLVTETTPLACSYSYKGTMQDLHPLENHSLRVGITPVDNGIGFSGPDKPIISTKLDYSREGNSGVLIPAPNTSGRYLLSLELKNSSLTNGPRIEEGARAYLNYYSRSEISSSKYRSALLILNILVLSSVILQARNLILGIEKS
jgi:hypothetical protein